MRIEESIDVDAAPSRVWKVVEDPAKLTGLDQGLTLEPDPDTPEAGLHARYRMLMRVGPVPLGSDVEIVECVPERELAWTSLTGVDHRFRLRLREVEPKRTRVTVRFGYSSAGPFGLLADVAAYGRVRALVRHLLGAVKAQAERPARRAPKRTGGKRTAAKRAASAKPR